MTRSLPPRIYVDEDAEPGLSRNLIGTCPDCGLITEVADVPSDVLAFTVICECGSEYLTDTEVPRPEGTA
jgi:hypothetical protein